VPQHHFMKKFGGVEGKLKVCGQHHAPSTLSQRKDTLYPLDEGLRGPTVCLDAVAKRKITAPDENQSPVLQSVANHLTVRTKKKEQKISRLR
jgi:hypothetical protein